MINYIYVFGQIEIGCGYPIVLLLNLGYIMFTLYIYIYIHVQ